METTCHRRRFLASAAEHARVLNTNEYWQGAGRLPRTVAIAAEWFNAGTSFVCANETAGTPNPALEAAVCGCTDVTTGVGNMPALIFTDNSTSSLARAATAALARTRRPGDGPRPSSI